MSLRSQLEELLPELLPSDPAQAIKEQSSSAWCV